MAFASARDWRLARESVSLLFDVNPFAQPSSLSFGYLNVDPELHAATAGGDSAIVEGLLGHDRLGEEKHVKRFRSASDDRKGSARIDLFRSSLVSDFSNGDYDDDDVDAVHIDGTGGTDGLDAFRDPGESGPRLVSAKDSRRFQSAHGRLTQSQREPDTIAAYPARAQVPSLSNVGLPIPSATELVRRPPAERTLPQRLRRFLWRWQTIVVCVLVLAIVLCDILLPVEELTDDVIDGSVEYLNESGAIALFMVVFVVCNLTFIPGVILSVVAGFLFFIFYGALVTWAAKTVSAIVAFGLGRTLFPLWDEFVRPNATSISLLEILIEKGGFRVMLYLRLSPFMPHAKLNYLLALTPGVTFGRYVVASAIGTIPSTIIFAWAGMIFRHGAQLGSGNWAKDQSKFEHHADFLPNMSSKVQAALMFLAVLSVMTAIIVLMWLVGRAMQRELRAASVIVTAQNANVHQMHASNPSYDGDGLDDESTDGSTVESSQKGPSSVLSTPVNPLPGRTVFRHGSFGAQSDAGRPLATAWMGKT